MANRKVMELGEECLRQICKPVNKFDLRLKILLKDMADTMYKANGVGLAAPQVGILRRVVVMDVGDDNGLIEMINPEVIATEGAVEDTEGCLSLPGRVAYVVRPEKATVRYFDRNGNPCELTGEGLLARCICHECDHLDGVLYIDKMERELTREEIEELNRGEDEEE